jgi:hypothetical protein
VEVRRLRVVGSFDTGFYLSFRSLAYLGQEAHGYLGSLQGVLELPNWDRHGFMTKKANGRS